MKKGEKPPTAKQLHETLIPLWKINSWKLVMLDNGFFEFVFSNIEEMRSVWSTGSWNLKFGIICFACHNGFRISALTLRNNIMPKFGFISLISLGNFGDKKL